MPKLTINWPFAALEICHDKLAKRQGSETAMLHQSILKPLKPGTRHGDSAQSRGESAGVSERRPLVVTIDGDGFIYNNRESGHAVGEVIRDRILRAYPFEFTASFIAHELEDYRSCFDVALAREIFALANVEAASHSWSHPHDWSAHGVDARREIVDSVRYLERQLLNPGKRVQMFLWSGLCNPTDDHLCLVESLGIGNLNGGDPLLPYSLVGGRRHYHSRAWNDWVGMGLQRRVGGMEAYLRTAPERLDGFSGVINFFEAHPRLPVHVYFHWYSGARDCSLDALRQVLDWCAKQDLETMPASRYVAEVDRLEVPASDSAKGQA